jgi:hypothetical protein
VANDETSLKNPGPLTKIAIWIAFIMISVMVYATMHSDVGCLKQAEKEGMSNTKSVLTCSSGEAIMKSAIESVQ